MNTLFQNRNAQLRARLDEGSILLVPGAYDGLSARLVEEAGAEAVYLSGSGVAASYGLPDIGLITYSDMVERAAQIAGVVELPIIADGDTGYGNATNVARTVRGFEQAGASAIQLEDQTFPKRCGHFEGKRVVPLEEMLTKLYAALDARRDDNFLIIARTDARAIDGLDEAIARGQAFAEAGADVVFVEAPRSVEELKRIPPRIDAPLMVNLPEGGKTPLLSAHTLEQMGYAIVIHANITLKAAVKTMQQTLEHLLKTGDSQDIVERFLTFEERDHITQLPRFQADEQRYLDQARRQLRHDVSSQQEPSR